MSHKYSQWSKPRSLIRVTYEGLMREDFENAYIWILRELATIARTGVGIVTGKPFSHKYDFMCNFQKSATAVAYCRRGKGNLRVNGRPLDMIEPRILQYKLQEPLLLLGKVRSLKNSVITMKHIWYHILDWFLLLNRRDSVELTWEFVLVEVVMLHRFMPFVKLSQKLW